MPIANYNDVDRRGDTDAKFIKVYNNLGSALAEGDLVVLSFVGSTAGYYPTVTVPATTSVPVTVGVVANAGFGVSGIPDASWGYIQTRGLASVTKTTAANPIAVNDFLLAGNGIKTAATESTPTTFTAKTFGIAKSVVATGVAGKADVYLFGDKVTI